MRAVLLHCIGPEVALRYRRQCIEITVAIGGTADMNGLAALRVSDANDPQEAWRL